MEEFRALTVDAVVLNLLRRDEVRVDDFSGGEECGGEEGGGEGGGGEPCRIGLRVRKAYLAALEAKLQSAVTHPLSGAAGDYRRAMRTQVALWIQVLQGAAPDYRPFMPR